jgi:hypothetical protein
MRSVAVAAMGACLLSLSSSASSAANPPGTGQPNQSCQSFGVTLPDGTMIIPVTPGNTANSPGSVFNEAGFGSPPSSGGTGGNAYNTAQAGLSNPHAVSQYDVACFQQSNRPQLP